MAFEPVQFPKHRQQPQDDVKERYENLDRKMIKVEITPEEHEEIRKLARMHGMRMPAYVGRVLAAEARKHAD